MAIAALAKIKSACYSFDFKHFIGFDRFARQPAYSQAVRLVDAFAEVGVVGDGWTFKGPSENNIKLPRPIHRYGWVFPENAKTKRIVRGLYIHGDLKDWRDNAESAEAGADPMPNSHEELFTGEHPDIIKPLIGLPRYVVRPDLLLQNSAALY